MPIYEYKCKNPECSWEFENVCPVSEHMEHLECPICGGIAQQQITPPVVHNVTPLWLNDNVRTQIQADDNSAPIETRDQYNAYCKKHNIVVTDKRV